MIKNIMDMLVHVVISQFNDFCQLARVIGDFGDVGGPPAPVEQAEESAAVADPILEDVRRPVGFSSGVRRRGEETLRCHGP